MTNPQQMNQHDQPQEIDLVDIAVVLYRRKAAILLTVCICFVVAIGVRFTLKNKIEVTAVFLTGKISSVSNESSFPQPIMEVSESVRLLNSIYIPDNIEKYSKGMRKQFVPKDIRVFGNIDKDDKASFVIVLISEVDEELAQNMISLMNGSLEDLLSSQQVFYEQLVSDTNMLLEAKMLEVESRKNVSLVSDANVVNITTMLRLETTILNLKNTLNSSLPSEILRPGKGVPMKPKSFVLFAIGGIFSGLFLGCMLAFFLELLCKAKTRAAETT